MNFSAAWLIVIALGSFCATLPRPVEGAVNGGSRCATCVVLVSLVEQYAEVHNITIVETLETLCSFLPSQFIPACDAAIEFLGPILVKIIEEAAGPDVACHALAFCRTDPGQPTCRSLEPSARFRQSGNFELDVLRTRKAINHMLVKRPIQEGICDLPGIKEICVWVKKFVNNHDPLVDADGDGFSTVFATRGSAWRGKDCSDSSSDIHPGAVPLNGDADADSNCNGIFGINNQTKKPYEEELCGPSQPRGIAVLGDSISAHFHLPPEWLDATRISKEAFLHTTMIVENELDWPMMSAVTGYGENNWTEAITGPVQSLYLLLSERNRCNHRDYQNIACNGVRSSSAADLVHTVSRQAGKDRPLILFYALAGNDVCNEHFDTFKHMTTPAEMFNNTMNTLQTLHKHLPNGSHVVMVGLADGEVLFNNMATRIHPLGTHWGTFTYAKFYDFFNCLEISPCRGWLNTNETIRHMTTKRAVELTNVLQGIAKNYNASFSNFKLHFLENPTDKAIGDWSKKGGEGWQLIEPSDGFHANQMGNAFFAHIMWEQLLTNYTDILGPENPNNAKIKELFGDQGGY